MLGVLGEIVPDVGAKTRPSSFSPYRRDEGARDSHPFAPWRGLVVPLEGLDVIALQCGEGVDVVGAQGGVHILGHELAGPGSVLGPVRIVTHTTQLACWTKDRSSFGDNRDTWSNASCGDSLFVCFCVVVFCFVFV